MARKAAQAPLRATTPAQAIAEGGLLAHDFQGASWARWRAILKAAYAEPMTADEVALFREVADRDPPTRRVRELWVIAGRRGGKDSIAAAIATVAALDDYSPYLRSGERATVMCLATDRTQALIVHRYVTASFKSLPALRPLVLRQTDDTLELRNGVEILIATNSLRAPRGRTVAVAIFDEVAYWRSSEDFGISRHRSVCRDRAGYADHSIGNDDWNQLAVSPQGVAVREVAQALRQER